MAIISTDINYRLSGGAANSDTAASLGGAKSSVAASNYFDDVSSAEASAGIPNIAASMCITTTGRCR